MSEKFKGGTLKEWEAHETGDSNQYLTGKIYGDSRFADGSSIITTNVISLQKDGAETENTIYTLEE